jgi:thioredoxin-related protein
MIDCIYCKKSIRKQKKERHQRECFKKHALFIDIKKMSQPPFTLAQPDCSE